MIEYSKNKMNLKLEVFNLVKMNKMNLTLSIYIT